MLKRGKYTTLNGHTAMIYKDIETRGLGNVLTVALVPYNSDGTPVYSRTPQDFALDLNSHQDIPAWKGMITPLS